MSRVIVVEDNPVLRDEIVFFLSHAGHQAKGVTDGTALDRALKAEIWDVVVLDIGLPGEDGFSIARRLSDRGEPGIVALTARSDLEDRVRGLRDGMDAYLTKPVDLRELAAVVEAVHRRVDYGRPGSGPMWALHPLRRVLRTPDERLVQLSETEVNILKALAEGRGEVVPRREIIAAMGHDYRLFDERRLEVAISRLRRKLSPDAPGDCPVRADRGTGYCFSGALQVVSETVE